MYNTKFKTTEEGRQAFFFFLGGGLRGSCGLCDSEVKEIRPDFQALLWTKVGKEGLCLMSQDWSGPTPDHLTFLSSYHRIMGPVLSPGSMRLLQT